MSLLDDDAISTALRSLQWERQGNELVKVHKSADFAGAMQFVNAVADRAEAANHHPDIDIRWNTVTLSLSTHSAGGLTQADLDMARQIDGLAAAG
jgi:4a-hydroxytetrahydrobiopterin dehydratase